MDRILKSILSETERGREWLRQEAAAKRAKSARRSSRSPRATGPTKEQKAARAVAETARIRAYVDGRDPSCVICLEPAPEPWELHHVDSGTGKTQRQTVRNCAKTHEPCHKRAHRGDLGALSALRAWADRYGYSETVAVLDRRITKAVEAREYLKRRCLYGALVCTHAQCQGETTP